MARRSTTGRVHTAVSRPLIATTLMVLALAGCSGTSTRSTSQDNALVTADEVAQASADSPKGVVLQIWRAVQVGDIPSAVLFYHERVRRTVGVRNIAGTLAQLRSTVALLHPEIVSNSRTPVGVELTVRATSDGSSVGLHSFLLRQSEEGWRVAYDTLLGDALPSYVEGDVHNRLAPRSEKPPRAAQLAAVRITTTYRMLFLESPFGSGADGTPTP